MQYSVREIIEADLDFIRTLHETSMRPHIVAQHGTWDAAFQKRKFLDISKLTNIKIIEFRGSSIGCIDFEVTRSHLLLDKLWLLPEHQNSGIGTHFIKSLIQHAKSLDIPIRLEVLKVNPAKRLYQKLGFVIVGETETLVQMEYSNAA